MNTEFTTIPDLGMPDVRLREAIAKRAGRFLYLGPEGCRQHAYEAATTMLDILEANYNRHNLSRNTAKLAGQISCGQIQPFLCARVADRRPIACAALIKLDENDVEIGRGACIPGENGGAGLPILLAVNEWLTGKIFPETKVLRGEVRTAKDTREVPGGQATQHLSFGPIGLMPTAIGPFFHHGVPDRQEMFFLAQRVKAHQPSQAVNLTLPGSLFSNLLHFNLISTFWKNTSNGGVLTVDHHYFDRPALDQHPTPRYEYLCQPEGPLVSVTPTTDRPTNGNSPPLDLGFDDDIRFAIAKIPLVGGNEKTVFQISTDLQQTHGFKLMGFENLWVGQQFLPHLLMGRLSNQGQNCLVASSFIDYFPPRIEDSLLANVIDWRNN